MHAWRHSLAPHVAQDRMDGPLTLFRASQVDHVHDRVSGMIFMHESGCHRRAEATRGSNARKQRAEATRGCMFDTMMNDE